MSIVKRLPWGGLAVGGFVVMTRSELERSAWKHTRLGARLESEYPGLIAQADAQVTSETRVRHLHAI